MASLKEQKEAFVTGHSGTTPTEILLVCASAPIGVFLYHQLKHYFRSTTISNHGRGGEAKSHKTSSEGVVRDCLPFGILIIFEALTILLPMAICQTDLLHPYGVYILLFEITLACMLYCHNYSKSIKETSMSAVQNVTSQEQVEDHHQLLEYLTYYRSTVSYLTFVAILAVDFTVFPRSFAKTETHGYGLMDLGAGSFIVSGGLVSRFARRGIPTTTSTTVSFLKVIRFQKMLPLLTMGLIRLWTIKGLDYQEHVSEYGIHWNFFFTLCIVGFAASILHYYGTKLIGMNDQLLVIGVIPLWMIILITYQYFLSKKGWQDYIENGPRQCLRYYGNDYHLICDLFAANREGILGAIGYLVLHLACEDIGRYCLYSTASPHYSKDDDAALYTKKHQVILQENYRQQGWRLFLSSMSFWILHFITTSILGIPVSRRSTNASFVLWTIAHNMTILFLTWLAFFMAEQVSSIGMNNEHNNNDVNKKNPPIFEAVNRNGLLVFILANLMTGAVNLSINTLEASRSVALFVIFCYLSAVGVVALFLDYVFFYIRRRPLLKRKQA